MVELVLKRPRALRFNPCERQASTAPRRHKDENKERERERERGDIKEDEAIEKRCTKRKIQALSLSLSFDVSGREVSLGGESFLK